ncbi:hypothetical protein [Millisia brevis]|uniref:hypothetical protein n=1 Tax=Millisia brevis TaxID=264148 RepID=UPI000832B022|nr:hypothetical protein [Millisia brevis]
MTTDIKTSEAPSKLRRIARSGRLAATTAVLGAATAAAIFTGGGIASAANSYPVVVGMTASDAHSTLAADGISYQTLLTVGSGSNCTITQQFDLGSTNGTWNGLGLWENCSA